MIAFLNVLIVLIQIAEKSTVLIKRFQKMRTVLLKLIRPSRGVAVRAKRKKLKMIRVQRSKG